MEEWLWGKNSVLEAFSADRRRFFEILILPGTRQKFSFLNSVRGVVVREVSRDELSVVSKGDKNQGIAALVGPKPYVPFSDVISWAEKKGESPFVLILDGICDSHNLGAILRTAEVAGVHGVVIPLRGAAGMSPVVSRVSSGGMEYMRVVREKNLVNLIKRMKTAGFWIAGLSSGGGDDIFSTDLGGVPLCLVVGGEEHGIRHLVREKCDFTLNIPQKGRVNSLNASVAAAIGIYEVLRQRASKRV